MPVTDPKIIKDAVRSNFDMSVDLYDQFEERYSLFKDLTLRLAELCGVNEGMTVCDMGCGTGSSTFPLADVVGGYGSVWGIDFSDQMLEAAREKAKSYPNVEFITGDIESVDTCFLEPGANVVLYNACIFLIPNTLATLRCAHGLLKEEGVVGMTYLAGLYKEPPQDDTKAHSDADLIQSIKEKKLDFSPYARGLVDTSTLPGLLKEAGFGTVREGIISRKISLEELRDFYTVPAQSTSLWSKTPYEERMVFLEKMIEHIRAEDMEEVYQWWGWYAGEK